MGEIVLPEVWLAVIWQVLCGGGMVLAMGRGAPLFRRLAWMLFISLPVADCARRLVIALVGEGGAGGVWHPAWSVAGLVLGLLLAGWHRAWPAWAWALWGAGRALLALLALTLVLLAAYGSGRPPPDSLGDDPARIFFQVLDQESRQVLREGRFAPTEPIPSGTRLALLGTPAGDRDGYWWEQSPRGWRLLFRSGDVWEGRELPVTSAYWRSLTPDFSALVCSPRLGATACRVLGAGAGEEVMDGRRVLASPPSPVQALVADWGWTFRFSPLGPEQRYPLPVALGCCLAGVGAYGGGRVWLARRRRFRRKARQAAMWYQNWRFLLEHFPDPVLAFDGKGIILHRNPAAARLLAPGGRLVDILPDLMDLDWSAFPLLSPAQVFARIAARAGRLGGVHGSGKVFPLEVYFYAMDGAAGYPFLAVMRDASSLSLAKEQLNQRETLLQRVLSALPVGVWVADAGGKILLENGAARDIWAGGMPFDGSVPYRARHLVGGRLGEPQDNPLLRALAGVTVSPPETVEIWRGDGSARTVLSSAVPLVFPEGKRGGAIVVQQDVTALRAAVDELKFSVNLLQRLFGSSPVAMCVVDLSGRYLMVNATFCRFLGMEEGELLQRTAWEVTYEEDIPLRQEAWVSLFAGGESAFQCEIRYRHRLGHPLWGWLTTTLVRDEGGHPLYLMSQMLDITERKAMESRLQAREAALSLAQRIGRLGFWEWHPATDELICSDEAIQMLGLPPGPKGGIADLFLTMAAKDVRAIEAALSRAVQDGTPSSRDCTLSLPAYGTRDRAPRIVHWQVEVLSGAGTAPRLVGTVQDISDRKAIEADLRVSSQNLRRLSAYHEQSLEQERKRVALELHDELGQYLSGLKMSLSVLRLSHPEDRSIQNKAQEMGQLVGECFRVVRQVVSNLRPSALNHGLVAGIEWLVQEFRRHTDMECSFRREGPEPDLGEFEATTLLRIVQESLNNAARHSLASSVKIGLFFGERVILLKIDDDGRGFDPDHLPPGKAFGLLGLKERATSLGGVFRLKSAPGQGTHISLSLPFAR